MPKKIEQLTFEDAYERLTHIIESMESGETPLAKLLTQFEEGSMLLKACQKKLQDAEHKVEKLNLETGNMEPFDDQANEA